MMKDYDHAIADFDTVIRLDPTRRMPIPPAPVLSSERVPQSGQTPISMRQNRSRKAGTDTPNPLCDVALCRFASFHRCAAMESLSK
jgi:hypothetical protein